MLKPYFFSSSRVKGRLHAQFQFPRLPGGALKVLLKVCFPTLFYLSHIYGDINLMVICIVDNLLSGVDLWPCQLGQGCILARFSTTFLGLNLGVLRHIKLNIFQLKVCVRQ